MHFVYRMLLFLIYFHAFVHCQGGRGGGGRGGGGRGYGRGTKYSTIDKDVHIGIGVGSVVFIVGSAIVLKLFCENRCEDRTQQEITIFDNLTYQKLGRQELYDVNPFQSGVWLSRYFQYEEWHGPHHIPLSFDSQSMKIKGEGCDDVGLFLIYGAYSTEKNQINLIKTYQKGTGSRSKNLGHQVTIQLTWNARSHQFEGKWNVQTPEYQGNGEFHLKFYPAYIEIESDSNGTFHMDSSYIEQLNGYVTHKDYLQFLSTTRPLLKRLKIHNCLFTTYLALFMLLGVAVHAVSISLSIIYLDMPFIIFLILFIVGVIVLICIGAPMYYSLSTKIKAVSDELKSTVESFSTKHSKWTLQMDDSSNKIVLHIEFSLPCQRDIVPTPVTTTVSTPQLNTTASINIYEPTSHGEPIVENNAVATFLQLE